MLVRSLSIAPAWRKSGLYALPTAKSYLTCAGGSARTSGHSSPRSYHVKAHRSSCFRAVRLFSSNTTSFPVQQPGAPTTDRSEADVFAEKLQRLRDAIINKPPICSGQFALAPEELVMYYSTKDGGARRLDFATATEAELKSLADACDLATFGVNQNDVFDETYRKAGKLDTSKFALKFDPATSGLLDAFRGDLLEDDKDKPIRAELYKLNVYGPGSFFKIHKDTPRGTDMFGSLVLVLPTSHTGGSLKFSLRGSSWTFPTANMVYADGQPRLAYLAYFSDVEHEVMPVESGYRVTLTYNLYYADRSAESAGKDVPTVRRELSHNRDTFRDVFKTLLADPTFMPKGGLIGFGLRHQYPFMLNEPLNLQAFAKRLKGSDAVVVDVCKELGLNASFKFVYRSDGSEENYRVLMDHSLKPWMEIEPCGYIFSELRDAHEGVVIHRHPQPVTSAEENDQDKNGDEKHDESDDFDEDEEYWEEWDENGNWRPTANEAENVHWVTDVTPYTETTTDWMAHGNEPIMGTVYGDVALLVKIERDKSEQK
ncbi:uncharacterized protein LAESUDRAFT_492397 [Laetiporus sulphureus 93-53]|uniref:Prolyl 4-hydroxylase alpha subunit Fe(2+) 2OG dioxygenase domain-containing protein n=1 Tax=Laetiporus sulphureus 93-53 TaxID=1314785 RepID=A0A165BIY5_9APHY|nr:uncharacterized protein LAESUDRAFT_492397 [Laetiporus sulphureus 93-53]KZT01145.1 hypothetical protein LAESUDRAFT_492397 [Laetiporus sulphureus 93-53]